MKIVRSNGSQLCNRLWSYAPIIGYSLSHNEKIFIIDFDKYSDLFPYLQSFGNVCFVNNKYLTIVCKLYSMLKYKMYGEVEVDFNLSKFARRLFVNGWDLRRSVQYITKNKNDILKIFSPSELVISKCNNIMKNLRNNDEIVVGIHVRRGDYKTFMDGKYYFSDDEYSDIIFEMQFLLKQNFDCKVKFFIASNEEFILNHLDIEYLQVSNSTPIEDLYLLSKCDYIIGPPSSFSMWASWYGSVPLKVFCRGAKIESLVKFKVVTAIDVFEDGSIITT